MPLVSIRCSKANCTSPRDGTSHSDLYVPGKWSLLMGSKSLFRLPWTSRGLSNQPSGHLLKQTGFRGYWSGGLGACGCGRTASFTWKGPFQAHTCRGRLSRPEVLDWCLECKGERDQVRFMTPELLIPEYAPPDKIPRNPGHAPHSPILSSLPPSCTGPCLKAPTLSGKLEESMWPGLPAWQPLF